MTQQAVFLHIKTALLIWYKNNHRVLPWRVVPSSHSNPYHVLVSEIMLQQTTVATVVPYFNRFTSVFPNIEALAMASEYDILTHWKGLGYYTRARNLYKSAQFIHQNGFPKKVADLQKLPGVGPYTAAAIAAIAFQEPIVPLDGNIARVFSRLFCLSFLKKEMHAALKSVLQSFIPVLSSASGDFAQALMDLGADVCKPNTPVCDVCPLKEMCQAFQQQCVAAYPIVEKKAPLPIRQENVYLIRNKQGAFLLTKNKKQVGLFAKMALFPNTLISDDNELFLENYDSKETSLIIRHTFTHFKLELKIYVASLKSDTVIAPFFWVSLHDIKHHPLPTLMQKVLKAYVNSSEAA